MLNLPNDNKINIIVPALHPLHTLHLDHVSIQVQLITELDVKGLTFIRVGRCLQNSLQTHSIPNKKGN